LTGAKESWQQVPPKRRQCSEATWRHIQEDSNLHNHRFEKLESQDNILGWKDNGAGRIAIFEFGNK
jgi:hypothetical protein